jgi:uncharacterized protein DUF5522
MPKKRRPVLGEDYIICEDGRAQFTAEFLARRGWYCEAECRFCPYPPEVRYASKLAEEEPVADKALVAADHH